MTPEDFDFDLPGELIAQVPADRRDSSRLMVVDRGGGPFECRTFLDLSHYLRGGDLLVLNDTRVIPARLRARKPTGGKVEILLVSPAPGEGEIWDVMVGGAKSIRPGMLLALDPDGVALVEGRHDDGLCRLRFQVEGEFADWLDRAGTLPLPPYIRRDPTTLDRERYQTVFARNPGAVAAPTAGLHFTDDLLRSLADAGVEQCMVTLHVGPGTFQPVRAGCLDQHRMHAEEFFIPEETARRIARCRERGGRVVAVGTTVVRALESGCDEHGVIRPGRGRTSLFIRPGFGFRVVDVLLTNFHLPRSTLLMLVCAFGGHERILAAYRRAVEERFRFYSYGDAMLIL